MARLFDSASSENLLVEPAIFTGEEWAVGCWFNILDEADFGGLFSLADKTTTDEAYTLYSSKSTNSVKFGIKSVAGDGVMDTTAGPSNNTWHHTIAIVASTTDKRIFLDGGNKGTTVASSQASNLSRTGIGCRAGSTLSFFGSGYIAEMACWDLSVWPGATASDRADNFEKIIPSLAKGFTPSHFLLGLTAYWDLIRGLNDKVGGYNLTADGTAVTPHTRIIMPY
ncbi:hypothetical protein LCGC14_0475050 [marine sediment metagenome]|uniref:LamG-like jellyroll fold domain-containing protein n=1 Tax=marine sediment metagenome TaxID=412755 RepID=A0A0F9STR7_9ZZZZ